MTQTEERQPGQGICYIVEKLQNFECQNLKGFGDRTHEFSGLSVKRAGDRANNIVKIC
ncbi:hypothetical protein [Microcoleus sp. bin38.metabat.b11b12b14.051]|uniref:hypothetical protein n=1 Tax=Microcoleus sp. bin38.metabat.b11b12b14.051 TaxID=2742709 RepID=UPI0025CBA80D|nr:hypothetical protein [Microcoleus sp. bin38.metabat.b11b12b14.051]